MMPCPYSTTLRGFFIIGNERGHDITTPDKEKTEGNQPFIVGLNSMVTFKPAEIFDVDTLLILIQEFYQIEHLTFDDNTCDALTNLLNNKSYGGVWLIQHQGETIGYVVLTIGYSLEFHGRDAFIDELYIRANYRGQGIGTKTLEYMQEVCRYLGIKALHLEVDRSNTKAKELYHRFGFKDHDRYLLTKWV